MSKEKPGNGRPLKAFHWWQGLWRSVFAIEHDDAHWHVEVNFLDWDERVALYRDGHQDRTQRLPARFGLDDGSRIEVRTSTYGIRRAHLVSPEGREQQLVPVPGSAERWRADLERRRPGLSTTISVTSFVVLLAVIVLQVPQGLEWLADLSDEVAPELPENLSGLVGVLGQFSFTSPWNLGSVLNTSITVAGLLALLERALRLRYSWWLDGLEGMDGAWSG